MDWIAAKNAQALTRDLLVGFQGEPLTQFQLSWSTEIARIKNVNTFGSFPLCSSGRPEVHLLASCSILVKERKYCFPFALRYLRTSGFVSPETIFEMVTKSPRLPLFTIESGRIKEDPIQTMEESRRLWHPTGCRNRQGPCAGRLSLWTEFPRACFRNGAAVEARGCHEVG
jgi:hypothetical protein